MFLGHLLAISWTGGVKSSKTGAIYGFPSHAERVLKIIPATGEVREIGSARLLGKYKWGGGCNSADGAIFGVPSDTDTVLRICPETDEVKTIGRVSNEKNKW
jgi:hypothetical protein